MEDVLDLYEEEYDPRYPTVCFDEKLVAPHADVRPPQPPASGHAERIDYEYKRLGTANLFFMVEPLAGWRHVEMTERRTKRDYAEQIRWLVDHVYPDAEYVRIVQDNLNTHTPAALYEVFPPEEARRILRRVEFHHTPCCRFAVGDCHGYCLLHEHLILSVVHRPSDNASREEIKHHRHIHPATVCRNVRNVG